MQRSGKMSIQDVINNTTVCFLTPPTTHLITTPHSPIYALNSKQQSLFIRGKPKHHFMITAYSQINVRTNTVNKVFLFLIQVTRTPATVLHLKKGTRASFSSSVLRSLTSLSSMLFHILSPHNSSKH